MNTETQPTETVAARRTRRAEPITKRTAKNGTVSYEFRADVGVKPDGSRDRRRFTFRTYAEARREYRKISSEVAAGTCTARTDITVDEGQHVTRTSCRGVPARSFRPTGRCSCWRSPTATPVSCSISTHSSKHVFNAVVCSGGHRTWGVGITGDGSHAAD